MKRICSVVFSFFLLVCMCFGVTSCNADSQYVRTELVGNWQANVKITDDRSLTRTVYIEFDFEGGYELFTLGRGIDEKGTYSIRKNTIKLKPDEKNDYTEKDGYTNKLSYVYNKYTGELSLYYLGEPCRK